MDVDRHAMKHGYGAVRFANGLQLNTSQLLPPTGRRSGHFLKAISTIAIGTLFH